MNAGLQKRKSTVVFEDPPVITSGFHSGAKRDKDPGRFDQVLPDYLLGENLGKSREKMLSKLSAWLK